MFSNNNLFNNTDKITKQPPSKKNVINNQKKIEPIKTNTNNTSSNVNTSMSKNLFSNIPKNKNTNSSNIFDDEFDDTDMFSTLSNMNNKTPTNIPQPKNVIPKNQSNNTIGNRRTVNNKAKMPVQDAASIFD